MELTSHEQKILDIVNNHPEILDNPEKRAHIAELYGLSEKTLRNRIAELKKYGLLTKDGQLNDPVKKTIITDDGEIDLFTIWRIIKLKTRLLLKYTLSFTTAGLIYSILATVYFESTISMYPAGELSQNNGLGEIQGLANNFGIGGFGTTPTYNIPDIINSRRLKNDIVLKNWVTLKSPKGSNLISYWDLDMPKLFSPKKWMDGFLPSLDFAPSQKDRLTYEAILRLDELISVKEENNGLITVLVLMQEPNLAANIANYIAEFVKEFISFEQKREVSRNKEFIENQKSDAKGELENSEELLTDFRNNYPTNLDSPKLKMIRSRLGSAIEENRAVYITLRQQYEIAKIEEAKENLFINILDYAEPAVEKTKPKRILILLLSLLFGTLVGITGILIRYAMTPKM
jgi:capsular polysaccharide biosynthesis protein